MPELQQPDIVGNFLSSYGTAQAQQQAQQDREFNKQRIMKQDSMTEQKFGMDQQAHQFKLAEEVVNMLGSVQDGDAQGFERAKQRWGQMGLPPEAVAGFTVADLPSLRVKAGTQLRELQAQQVRAQTAAASRSNRHEPRGVAGPGGPALPSNEQIDNEAKLRGEYFGQSKEFTQVRDAYGRVAAAAQDPSAAGDLALIFNYMKMLDPGSVVREQEFANAQNAAGVPDRVRAAYNNALSGERLADNTRADFVDRASRLFETQLDSSSKTREVFGALADQYGFDRARVAPDISLGMTRDITRPKAAATFTGSGVLQDQSRSSAPVDSISAADALLGLK